MYIKSILHLILNQSKYENVIGLAADAADPAIFGIFRKSGLKRILNLSKWVGNHVKLNFLTAALDPQTGVERSQNFGGFMPIFRLA